MTDDSNAKPNRAEPIPGLNEPVTAVYIRIPRTASTSIESALRCEERVLTNAKTRLLPQPQQDWVSLWSTIGLSNLWIAEIGDDRWRDLKSFSFVRNPYDRAISSWRYVRHLSLGGQQVVPSDAKIPKPERCPADSFDHFLQLLQERHLVNEALWHVTPQTVHILDSAGNQNVGFVARFETLQQDFDSICDWIGMTRRHLPVKNRSWNARKHYSEFYNLTRRRIVERYYAEDIAVFEYDF